MEAKSLGFNMKMKTFNGERGLTLVEILITVAIIGIVFSMSAAAIRFVNTISREKLLIEGQRDAEVLLYDITKEVRDAKKIVAVSSGTLTLQIYNLTAGYDINANNFANPNNLETLIYEYRLDRGVPVINRRRYASTASGGGLRDSKFFLRNLIEPDDPSTSGTLERIFTPAPDPTITEDFDLVNVTLRIRPRAFEAVPRIFQGQVMVRASVAQ